jgi:hypothetical protein
MNRTFCRAGSYPPFKRLPCLLALHRWQREWQQGIVFHGGCGSLRFAQRLVSTPKSLRYISRLHHIRQRIPATLVNKTG